MEDNMSNIIEDRAKIKQIINILIQKTKNESINELVLSLSNKLNTKYQPVINAIVKVTNYLPENTNNKERIYHIMNDLYERPICKNCQIGYPKFINLNLGYRQYCSNECSRKIVGEKIGQYSKEHSKELLEKRTNTILKKYGVKNISNMKEINETKSNTWKNKTKEDIEKIVKIRQETSMEHFGVTVPSKSNVVKEKIKQTNLERYGVPTTLNIDSCRQSTTNTVISKMSEIMKKRKETNLVKYGIEHTFQSERVKEKIKQTNLERYGVSNPAESENIYKKIKHTNLERYGTIYPLQNQDIKDSLIKTLQNRYNVINASQIESVKRNKQQQFFNILINSDRLKDHYQPNFDPNEYSTVDEYYEWKCLKCNTIFKYCINNGRVPRCPTCYPHIQTSLSETEITNFCKSYFDKIYENSRSLIPPYEIDIYIPEIKLGIEFNGLYWHSDLSGSKSQEYHQNKLLLALQNNIQLVQIFEDEWRDQSNIVKSILLNKFNKNQNKIFARKCKIYSVPIETAKQFYFDNHLQGFINGQHLGLYYNDEFVSMMTIGKSRFNINYEIEIYRFCNKLNTSVIGGLSRLLNAFINILKPKSIITYADARYGIGSGYYKCGFKFVGTTEPGYYYMKHYNQRKSRNQFQKHLLQNKLESFDEKLTEWENMQLNGYDRIWDCGNFIYELKF